MLGTEYFTYDQFDFEAKTQNSPTDDIPTLNAGSTRTYTSTTKTAYRILSGFGRINYNYDMRYLISFVARYDGISKLKDNQVGDSSRVCLSVGILWKKDSGKTLRYQELFLT